MSPRRLLYVFFTKCIVAICLSKKKANKKNQSSTLGQMFSSSLLIALVYFCFFLCSQSKSQPTLFFAHCFLLIAYSFTLLTLSPALISCFQLLPRISYVLSCCNLSPIIVITTVLIFHCYRQHVDMMTLLTCGIADVVDN